MSTGRLFLIPTPLGADQDPLRVLPPSTIEIVSTLTHFVAENARTARAVLKRLPLAAPIQQLNISELSEHTTADALPRLLAPALAVAEEFDATVANMRFVKPLDVTTLLRVIHRVRQVVTLEENVIAGGFGSAIAELCSARGLNVPIRQCGRQGEAQAQAEIGERPGK